MRQHTIEVIFLDYYDLKYPLLLINVSSLFEITIYLRLGSIRGTKEFQYASVLKLQLELYF